MKSPQAVVRSYGAVRWHRMKFVVRCRHSLSLPSFSCRTTMHFFRTRSRIRRLLQYMCFTHVFLKNTSNFLKTHYPCVYTIHMCFFHVFNKLSFFVCFATCVFKQKEAEHLIFDYFKNSHF